MIITFPGFFTAEIVWEQHRMEAEYASAFGSQTFEIGAPLWMAQISPRNYLRTEITEWEDLLFSLEGRKNQLALWHLDRPAPRGTMRGALTFNGAHAQGANVLNISGGMGQAGKTLLNGDMLGFGVGTTQQVVRIKSPATADVNGNISVSIEPPLRNAFLAGDAIVWDKPKALFRRKDSKNFTKFARGGATGPMLDLVEDWRP